MLELLSQMIWLLLDVLISLYECLQFLVTILKWSYDHLRHTGNAKAQLDSEVTFLEQCRKDLSKIPRHLSIIIGPNEKTDSREILSKVFQYAEIMDISYISYYDTRKTNNGSKRLEKIEMLNKINCTQLNCLHKVDNTAEHNLINTKCNGVLKQKNGVVKNGKDDHNIVSNKTIQLREITHHDGAPLIAEVCRTLFDEHTKMDDNMIDNKNHKLIERVGLTHRITEELGKRLDGLTNPDMAIVFNSSTSTFGMLPWHTSFTEFHTFTYGGWCFDAVYFARMLYKFAKCEQRWGR